MSLIGGRESKQGVQQFAIWKADHRLSKASGYKTDSIERNSVCEFERGAEKKYGEAVRIFEEHLEIGCDGNEAVGLKC